MIESRNIRRIRAVERDREMKGEEDGTCGSDGDLQRRVREKRKKPD